MKHPRLILLVPVLLLLVSLGWVLWERVPLKKAEDAAPAAVLTHQLPTGVTAAQIQQALDSLPAQGGEVRLSPGLHELESGLQLLRSGLSLVGSPGTVLRLRDGVNQPVILLGCDQEVPTFTIHNLRVANLEIDGNRSGQTSETDPARPWIRNNGIDIRAVEGLVVERVSVYAARSGGIVASWKSADLLVTDSRFEDNQFDGIALYDSERILVRNFLCRYNRAAGLSFDNDLHNCRFEDGSVILNGDVGLFARHSRALEFDDVEFAYNGWHGVFLAHREPNENSGVRDFSFVNCSFVCNGGSGIWVASPNEESPGNRVSHSHFAGNGRSAVELSPDALLALED